MRNLENQSDLHEDSSGDSAADPLLTYCSTHPRVPTRLRCGKCERPICPKCMIYTPVGARCRICADIRPLPQFQVGASLYLTAIGVALVAAVLVGFAWAVIVRVLPVLSLFAVLGAGYAVGEAISRVVRRKRGRGLKIIAVLAVLLAFALRGLFVIKMAYPGLDLNAIVMIDLALSQYADLIAGAGRNLMGTLVFALGLYIAATRL